MATNGRVCAQYKAIDMKKIFNIQSDRKECKTGEFRQDIDKYANLRKRLNVEKSQFLLCIVGLSPEQAQGLSSMYDLTFVNEKNFLNHVEKLI
jgi:hypothetical protein